MKLYKTAGVFSCMLMIVSCFAPWAFYSDIQKSFNGFFSEQNVYGKPGWVFLFIAVFCIAFILTDRLWAKRAHLFFSALTIAYLIKTYSLFTSCYNTICPVIQWGMYLLVASSVGIVASSLFVKSKILPGNDEQ